MCAWFLHQTGIGDPLIQDKPTPAALVPVNVLLGRRIVTGSDRRIGKSPVGMGPFHKVEMKRTIASILGEKPLSQERFLPDASWSKGNQEAFRRGPRERPETPKQWNRRPYWRVHPYWTSNLKYVY
jgi:hypothetical protein